MDQLQRELRPPAVAPARLPLSQRRRAARVAAATRIAARTTAPLSPDQRRRDPLVRDRPRSTSRILRALKATAGSLLIHAGIVGLGFLVGTETVQREKIDQKMVIEVREPPPPPPLPPEPAQIEAEVPRPAPRIEKKAPPPKAPPPPEPEPAEPPPKTPPPRVVGLSLESTTEGGGGPAFAVGNTRQGATAERAVDPAAVPPAAPGEPAPGTNQTASRLPSAGVVYTKPVRKRVVKPVYPETLKAQGLEADVKVSLNLDATGKVVAVKILTPSSYPEFNEAARVAALAEEYEPALRDGAPIPYSLPFTYRFRLQDD